MNVQYKAKDFTLTDDIRSFTNEKLQSVHKLLGNYDEKSISYDVDLTQDPKHTSGNIYRADITVHAGGERVHAVGHAANDMNAAVDAAKDELVRRLRRAKGKKDAVFMRGARAIKKMLRWG